MTSLHLSPLEQELVRRSADVRATRRRIWLVAVTGLATVLALTAFAFWRASLPGLYAVSVVYVLVTILEKVGYGRAVLGYKGLIGKFAARVEMLEAEIVRKQG